MSWGYIFLVREVAVLKAQFIRKGKSHWRTGLTVKSTMRSCRHTGSELTWHAMASLDKLLDEARRISVEVRYALWSARVSACAIEREARAMRSERKQVTVEPGLGWEVTLR